jgi:uncharacterized coiled-coil protein SlyX
MAIKPIRLQHSTFDLEYDANKHWSHDDTNLVAAAEKLIDYKIEQNRLSNIRFSAHIAVGKEMEPLEIQFAELTGTIKELSKHTDEFDIQLTGFIQTNIDSLIEELDDVEKKVTAFHRLLLPLSNSVMELYPKTDKTDEDENIDEIIPEWEHYNKIKTKHCNNWGNQSIDIVSFDRFDERMKSHFAYLEKMNSNNRYFINDILSHYNIFISKIEGIYLFWDELQKRVVLLNRFLNSTDSIEKIQKLN